MNQIMNGLTSNELPHLVPVPIIDGEGDAASYISVA